MNSTIGVVELPALARTLADAGFGVVSGENYRQAATAIRSAIDAGRSVPVVVSDARWPGQKSWSERIAVGGPLVVVRIPDGSGLTVTGASAEMGLPLVVDHLLAALGLATPASLSGALIQADGSVTLPIGPPAAAPAPVAIPAPAAPVYETAPVPPAYAPVYEQPQATPVPLTPAADPGALDPWEEQILAREQPQATPAPAPVAPAYEQAPTYAPQPVGPAAVPYPAEPHVEAPLYPSEPPYTAHPDPAPISTQAPVRPAAPTYAPEPIGYQVPPEPAYAQEPARGYRSPVTVDATPSGERYAPPAYAPARPDPSPFDRPTSHVSAPGGSGGQVVVVAAGKGGVGKTTTSISLAQRLAKTGRRVVLIDANFGQSDITQYLRIDGAGLPSILDIALSPEHSVHAGICGPDSLNATRADRLDPLHFALIAGPPPDQADPDLITPEVYSVAVEQARRIADLVVVDTQIVEDVDLSGGMVDQFLMSLLHDGAWLVGLTDISPGIKNLCRRLRKFAADGIPRARMLSFVNRAPDADFNQQAIGETIGEHSVFLGIVFAADATIPMAMNQGLSVCDLPAFAPMLDAILAKVTGRTAGDPAPIASARPTRTKTAGKKARKGWFR